MSLFSTNVVIIRYEPGMNAVSTYRDIHTYTNGNMGHVYNIKWVAPLDALKALCQHQASSKTKTTTAIPPPALPEYSWRESCPTGDHRSENVLWWNIHFKADLWSTALLGKMVAPLKIGLILSPISLQVQLLAVFTY